MSATFMVISIPFRVWAGGELLGMVPWALGDEVGSFAAELNPDGDRFAAGDAEALGDLLFEVEFTCPETFASTGDGVHAAEHESADRLPHRVPGRCR